jgi:hypothetical protein
MSASNEEALATLRRRAEGSQQRYMQTLGEIKAKKSQLDESMAALTDLGCTTIADAEQLAERLQKQIDQRLTEIGRLLG